MLQCIDKWETQNTRVLDRSELTKREALDLITPVVDGEVDRATRETFLRFIKGNADVRRQYESEKRIKNLISSRCPSYKAPDSLKNKVSEIINKRQYGNPAKLKTQYQDYPASGSPGGEKNTAWKLTSSSTLTNATYALAASLMIFIAFWGIVILPQESPIAYTVEEHVYAHFTKNEGKMIKPSIATASLASAEVALSNSFNFSMTIPPLKNAEFKGVVYADFIPEYKSPLLEYYLPDQDQYIYIFAFKIRELENFEKLSRDRQAIEECVYPEDFHIENVNGKHVVSWKWDDTWYAAISNHDGNELAALIEPLNYTPKKRD